MRLNEAARPAAIAMAISQSSFADRLFPDPIGGPIAEADFGPNCRKGWSKLASFAMGAKEKWAVGSPIEAGARISMLDASAYRSNETNAKRAIADWRLSNINDPYIFQNQGFPVRVDSFLDLAQILDTMQEDRFDFYIKEIGGFTEEDKELFVKVCLDYVDFYHSVFQRDRVVLPLSTMMAHFVIYKKLSGFSPNFSRLLELGPGCGYLSFFLRDHKSLVDYTQIESTESFYLLQSHINSHIFGSRFDEHALSKHALNDHGAYHPKLKWHNPFHYEEQKVVSIARDPVCNHFPWWRIGDVAKRKYDIVSSNANLNEFSREALFQYLSLIRDVLSDDGVIISQCLGGGPPTYDSIFANMKSAGFVPVGLVQIDNVPGRIFVVTNGIFVGEKHPLYAKFVDRKPTFPMLERDLEFINKMYFINEENAERKKVYSTAEIMAAISDGYKNRRQYPELARSKPTLASSEQKGGSGKSSNGGHSKAAAQPDKTPAEKPDVAASKGHMKEVGRLQRIAQKEVGYVPQPQIAANGSTPTADVEGLRGTLAYMYSSKSWRFTAPIRKVGNLMRGRGLQSDSMEASRLNAIYSAQILKGEIEALQSSTSWRITAPLRFVMQLGSRR